MDPTDRQVTESRTLASITSNTQASSAEPARAQPSLNAEEQSLPTIYTASAPAAQTALLPLHESISAGSTSALGKAESAFSQAAGKLGTGLVKGAKILAVGVILTASVFVLAKTVALISGVVSSALAGMTLLSPIGWVYLALRSKEERGKDFQALIEAALWPSAVLTTGCLEMIKWSMEVQDLSKTEQAFKRLDIVFTCIGATAGSVALGTAAAVSGLAPAAVTGLLVTAGILGCGTWIVFPGLQAELDKTQ